MLKEKDHFKDLAEAIKNIENDGLEAKEKDLLELTNALIILQKWARQFNRKIGVLLEESTDDECTEEDLKIAIIMGRMVRGLAFDMDPAFVEKELVAFHTALFMVLFEKMMGDLDEWKKNNTLPTSMWYGDS